MLNIINKPADQIDVGDIQELVTSQVPEGQQLEFKKTLPGDGKTPDPWLSRQNKIDTRSRNELLEEAVAFANAQGGTLLVGISESQDKPPVADKVIPLPQCVELAERLRKMLRDCVEPQVPKLEVFGVPVNGDAGVIVIQVGQSRLAQHRVIPTKVCPIRRADRCESMNMWEIQDMTLNVSRGMERFEKRLQERSERFQEELKHLKTPEESFGIRFTALPVGDDVRFDRVFRREDLIPKWLPVFEKKEDSQDRPLENPQGYPPQPSENWSPILRAARYNTDTQPGWNYMFSYQELHCDGMLELGFVSCNNYSQQNSNTPFYFDPDWAFTLFANAVNWADHIRKSSSAPMAEYGLQVEIKYSGENTVFVQKPNQFYRSPSILTSIIFPNYSLDVEDTQIILLKTFHRDFWNGLGRDGEVEFVIGEEKDN